MLTTPITPHNVIKSPTKFIQKVIDIATIWIQPTTIEMPV